MARLKLFEDEQTKTIHERYFPHQHDRSSSQQPQSTGPTPASPTSCQRSSSHCPPSSCCPRSYSCHHQCHSHTQGCLSSKPSPQPDFSSSIATLQHKVTEIASDTKSLKTSLRDLIPELIASKTSFSEEVSDGQVQSPESDAAGDISDKPNSPPHPYSDESIASAEEFIDDDLPTITNEDNLNCSLTIQQ